MRDPFVVLVGYLVQNIHLKGRFNDQTARMTDVMRAEPGAVRAEMEKSHSELLARIAEHEHKRD